MLDREWPNLTPFTSSERASVIHVQLGGIKNVITISEYILCGEQCRYEIFDRESDENNLDLEFFICQSAASKNYRSKISIYIDHWDYLI